MRDTASNTSNGRLLSTSELGRILMGYMQLLGRGTSSCCMAPCGTSVGLTGMSPVSDTIKVGSDQPAWMPECQAQ